ncbi:MAG: hypothetical protein ACLRRA_10110 [Acutalibacteraceae bacterium]
MVGAMIRAGYGFGTVDNQYRVNVTGCEKQWHSIWNVSLQLCNKH